MDKMVKKYQNELEQVVAELEKSPDGYLAMKKSYYYQNIDRKQKSITKDIPLIKQLCRKKYLQARRKDLENALERPLKKAQLTDPRELITKLPNAYQNLPISYFYHPAVEKWLVNKNRQNTINPKSAKYISDGFSFRSMSERMIAEQIVALELPYKADTIANFNLYETFSPDFIVKNPFTNKTVVWEHFGAFNKEGYADSMNDKMDKYLKHGYSVGENLIVTFEYHLRDMSRIRKLLEKTIWN